jgi:hypothetical protein
MSTNPNEHWLTRDHVLVIQAARNIAEEPIYAERLWAQAENPERAALQLLDLLMRDRVVPAEVVEP